MNPVPQQLTLGMSLGSDLDFERFVPGGNADALRAVRHAATAPSFVYLWSETATGKTHLLHAACREAAEAGRRVGLLSLAEAMPWPPAMLDGWETMDLVALDDIDAIAGKAEWEQAVFALYNALRDAGRSLLVAAKRSPAGSQVQLADLKSRLAAMLVFQLRAPDDDARLRALSSKAKARGIELPEDVARYLLVRVSRDMHDLARLVAQLDQASLAHKRRLTIPFVRELLGD